MRSVADSARSLSSTPLAPHYYGTSEAVRLVRSAAPVTSRNAMRITGGDV